MGNFLPLIYFIYTDSLNHPRCNMNNRQAVGKKYQEQSESDRKIKKAKFCIISNYGYLFLRNSLMNFTLDDLQ